MSNAISQIGLTSSGGKVTSLSGAFIIPYSSSYYLSTIILALRQLSQYKLCPIQIPILDYRKGSTNKLSKVDIIAILTKLPTVSSTVSYLNILYIEHACINSTEIINKLHEIKALILYLNLSSFKARYFIHLSANLISFENYQCNIEMTTNRTNSF